VAFAVGAVTVSEDGLAVATGVVAFAAGAVAFAVGVLTVSEDGLAVAAGVVASVAGGLTVSEDELLVVAAGAVVAAAGAVAAAAGAVAAAAGGMTVSEDWSAVATGATAAAAQWSEIMFSSVTAKLLSVAPELAAPPALCPTSVTSWPICDLRSTLLVVILKI